MFIQSELIVDADEDGDTILGYLDSGLDGDIEIIQIPLIFQVS